MGKYLDFYNKCIEDDRIPLMGLCGCIGGHDGLLDMVHPTYDDLKELSINGLPTMFWGREEFMYGVYDFTPLRQNIVLLMAAMNGEL